MGKPKVVFWLGNRDLDLLATEADLARLKQVAEFHCLRAKTNMAANEVADAAGGAVAVISSWGAPNYTTEVLDLCTDLKLFARIGGSLQGAIDRSAWDRGVRVVTSVDAQGFLLADLTLGLMLAGLHRFPFYVRQQWGGGPLQSRIDAERVPQRSLIGKRVGLLGFGAIGQHVARLLVPFDCEVRACDPHISDEVFAEHGVVRAEHMDVLCEWSEVLSFHAAHNVHTDKILSREALARLQPGALVVNTSYGELIDMDALSERLETGTLFACLDMVAGGMPGGLDRLRYHPNCMITPTISGHSDGIVRMGRQVIDEVIRFLQGEQLLHEVEKTRLDSRA